MITIIKNATVGTLLQIPSCSRAYLAAGSSGAARIIERIDILEHPFPEVSIYLVKNEFIFTSFWNSKDSKSARISLIREMINVGCAGIGIMPGLHLNNIVDQEIIDLGNQYDFPVLVLDEDCRWSDIIKEFYLYALPNKSSVAQYGTYELLDIVDQFKNDKNLSRLGIGLEKLLRHKIMLYAESECYVSKNTNVKDISKIQSLFTSKNYACYSLISPYFGDSIHAECIFGKNSYAALLSKDGAIPQETSIMFRDIAVWLLQYFDKGSIVQPDPQYSKIHLQNSERYFLFYMKHPVIEQFLSNVHSDFLLYDYNKLLNYVIGLWRYDTANPESVFSQCAKLIRETTPSCLVFSDSSTAARNIAQKAKYVISQMENILIRGVFTVGELPILNLLNIAPLTAKSKITSYTNQFIDTHTKLVNLDTLRLFLVLRSITRVAKLLDIHPNTVKYRILKALKNSDDEAFALISDHHNIECLFSLENLKLDLQDTTT